MRRAARVDSNHAEIKVVFEKLGCLVLDLSRCGDGIPDLLIAVNGRWMPVEVKDGRKIASAQKLTQAQQEIHSEAAEHGSPIPVVNSIETAIELVRGLRGNL
jgi:hypothetical protein